MREAVTIHFSYTGLCDSVQLTNFTLCCIPCGFIRCSILLNSFFLIQFNVWHFPQYQYSQPNEVQKCCVCVSPHPVFLFRLWVRIADCIGAGLDSTNQLSEYRRSHCWRGRSVNQSPCQSFPLTLERTERTLDCTECNYCRSVNMKQTHGTFPPD